MKRLLVEGAELFHQDCNSIDRVMMYLDNNLHILHDQLNEENFNRILDIIWSYLNDILQDLIQANLEVMNRSLKLKKIFYFLIFLLEEKTSVVLRQSPRDFKVDEVFF